MKLSRTVSYALQATLQLAQTPTGQPVPCSRLAAAGQMPGRFLLQILRSLVTHGILHSTRGVEGGYALDRSSDQISLLDIIEAIDGPINSRLTMGDEIPTESQERLRNALSDVATSTRERLESIKLSSLLPAEQLAVAGAL